MAPHALERSAAPDQFARLHRLFVQHYGMAVGLAWAAACVAATQAPWMRNIRGLIDPHSHVESTASFLFGFPLLLAAGWLSVRLGGDLLRRTTMFRNCAVDFAVAGAVAFAVFCMSIHRVVVAVSLAG